MKFCVYCGHEVDLKTNICPHCYKDISDNTTTKILNSHIKCIKCGSDNIDCKIKKVNKGDIIFEEETYTCKKCGKKFSDKDRLGTSFNNNFQIILDKKSKKLIKWCIIFLLIIILIIYSKTKNEEQDDNWVKMDCSGLTTMSFKEIKKGSPYSDDKYIGNSYIFTTTIKEINDRKIVTPIEDGDYSGSYITFNKEEIQKLSKYKQGDHIKFCGTVKKISIYNKVYVENATIIE